MRYVLLLLGFLCTTIVSAQTLTIEELWNQLNTTNIAKQDQLQIQIAQQDLTLERLNRYPTVYGEANLQHNLITPTTPVPAIAFDPNALEGSIRPLRFATKWNSRAGIQAEWNIFDPTRKTAVQEKVLLLEKAKIQQAQSEQTIKKDATLAYTSIVLASLQHQVAVQDSALYQKVLQITQERYEAGRESAEQHLLARQEYERKKMQLYDTWAVLQEANLELQRYVDLTSIQQVTSGTEQIRAALSPYERTNFEAQLTALELQINDNQSQLVKRQKMPTVSLNGYYGGQYFDNSLNLFKTDNWFGNSFINASVRIPISAHFTQLPALTKVAQGRSLYQLQLEESTRTDDIKRQQQQQKRLAAEKKVQALQTIVALAQESFQQHQVAFEEGRLLLSELHKSNSNYLSTQKELWQAEYDLIALLMD